MNFLKWLGILAAYADPVPDGTKCGSEMIHRWHYLHEDCQGGQYLICGNDGCGIEGKLEFHLSEQDYQRYERVDGKMILRSKYNPDVHYDINGMCRFCKLPPKEKKSGIDQAR